MIGYNGPGRGDSTVIIQTSGVLNAGDLPTAYTIAGNDALSADFLSVELRRGDDGRSVLAVTDLRWYDDEQMGGAFDQADGTFTLEKADSSFELGSVLADRAGSFLSGWDGKSLTKEGAGTLRLNGLNTYSGGTTVNGGTLVAVSEGALGSGKAFLADGTRLVLLHDGVFTNEVHGTGTVEIHGDMYVDCDESLHTGRVELLGSLGLAASRTRSVTSGAEFNLAEGARLHGNGAVGNLHLASGSTVAPGHSIGNITVNGNLTFSPGSVYEVEIDPAGADSDELIVTGSADLGGATVRLVGLGTETDYTTTGEWTILQASGGYGDTRFAGQVDESLLFLDSLLLYPNPTDVVLRVERNSVEPADYARTPNQRAVAGALNGLAASGGSLYGDLMSVPAGTDLADLYDQLSGELHPSIRGALQNYDRQFGRSLRNRLLNNELPQGTFPAWIEVEGYAAEADGRDGVADTRHKGLNLTIGAETRLAADLTDPGWLAGAAFRYGRSEIKANSRHSKADVDSFSLGLYAGREFGFASGDLRLSLGASYGVHRVDAERRVKVPQLRQELDSEYTARSFQGQAEIGYRISLGEKDEKDKQIQLEPYLGAAWNSVWTEKFRESGGNAALKADGEQQGNFTHSAGLRLSAGLAEQLDLKLDAAWVHIYGDRQTDSDFRFRQGGEKFEIIGTRLPRDAAALSAGLNWRAAEKVDLYLGYDGAIGERFQSHGGNLGVKYTF